MQTLHEQVANHMHICVVVGNGIETLYVIPSSKPILSEAASYIMWETKFSMTNALKLVLSGFCINQGDHGELLVATLFTCARDLLVNSKPPIPAQIQLCHSFSVNNLFSHLFTNMSFKIILAAKLSLCHLNAVKLPFGETFKDTHMHFNHFIKPQEQAVIMCGNLLLYLASGVVALGTSCQQGFNSVYPFIYGGPELFYMQVGFILIQVKNDSNVYWALLNAFLIWTWIRSCVSYFVSQT